MEGLEIYSVELYLKVRLACADDMSKRAAARHFNISRDTVAKMLAYSEPPGYRRTSPIRRPKLDGFTEIIDAWLDGDGAIRRNQHHTAKRVFDRLREEHGFSGGYTIVKDLGGSKTWAGVSDRRINGIIPHSGTKEHHATTSSQAASR